VAKLTVYEWFLKWKGNWNIIAWQITY
jgi:hypothetical protein